MTLSAGQRQWTKETTQKMQEDQDGDSLRAQPLCLSLGSSDYEHWQEGVKSTQSSPWLLPVLQTQVLMLTQEAPDQLTPPSPASK